jgi:hypothetical protein
MSKFNVCIIQPKNYIHSLAFLELGELITHSLIELGHEAYLAFNQIQAYSTNIIIGCHLLDPNHTQNLPKSTIILNTEQISDEPTSWNTNITKWAQIFSLWDYSVKNIEKFHQNGITHAKHLKIGYQKELDRLKPNTPKDIDVLFYGCINERRQKIINQLLSRQVWVKLLFGVYGAERDHWIERSKLIMNIHYYESQIFEIVRVFYLLTNSRAVIAEINETTSIESIYKPAIESSEYIKFAEKTIELLSNPNLTRNLELKAQQEIKKYPQKLFTEEILN